MRAKPAIELAVDARAQLGEGPCWEPKSQTLYWVDIYAACVHAFTPATRAERTWRLDFWPGCVVTREKGGLFLGSKKGFGTLDPASGRYDHWLSPEPDQPLNRINDGKVDPKGRLWAGSQSSAKPVSGGLFRLDADRSLTRLLSGVGCSNGLAWSADGAQFYYIDTVLQQVRTFACDPELGTIGAATASFPFPSSEYGWADGMCIDAEGLLWIAHFGGGMVSRWDPRTGKLVAKIPLPVSNVTSCAFGGPKYDQLYITTARIALSEEQMHQQNSAGGVFVADVGTTGLPATPFAG
jgi:sugar lactone lactonase YvrE